MNTLIEKEVETRSFRLWEGQAEYVDEWFLMPTPYPVLFITISYLLFVLKLGPEFMKHRSPYVLQKVLFVYNLFQVFFSLFLVSLGVRILLKYGLFHRECLVKNENIRQEILSKSYWYVIGKVLELLDTVFFVLRKKQKQVSFLHVYHHTLTFTGSWLMVKYARVDDLVFCGTLNSFIHIIMYGYYALSVFPSIAKNLWWKKHLTKLQLVQFIMVFIYFAINTSVSECPPSYTMQFLLVANVLIFLYLFSDFYRKSYNKEKVKDENLTSKSVNENFLTRYTKNCK